jgi:MerR family mercuric resistance operon transcriptional regulator
MPTSDAALMPSVDNPTGKAQHEATPNAAKKPPAAITVLAPSPPDRGALIVARVSTVMAGSYTLEQLQTQAALDQLLVTDMVSKSFLSIGVLSRQSKVAVETIRYYERSRLLPAPPRSAGGYRMYSSAHVDRLRFIRRARDLGLSIDEVRHLLGLADQKSKSCGKVRDLGAHHLADIRARIADLKRMERVLSRLVDACAKGELTDCPLLEALAHADDNFLA